MIEMLVGLLCGQEMFVAKGLFFYPGASTHVVPDESTGAKVPGETFVVTYQGSSKVIMELGNGHLFLQQREEVWKLKAKAKGAGLTRRKEILGTLLQMAKADAESLLKLKIGKDLVATAAFALQPVLLETIEQVGAHEDQTIAVAYFAVRADRIRETKSAMLFPPKFSRAEILTWARGQQDVQPKILKELEKASVALRKVSKASLENGSRSLRANRRPDDGELSSNHLFPWPPTWWGAK